MNRDEYLRQLRGYLNNMPDDEVEDVIEYYFEYLTDAGMDSEADIISELGTPDKLAQTINDDYRKMNEYIDEQDNNSKNEVILYQSSFYNNHRRAYNNTSYNNTQRSYGNTGYNNATINPHDDHRISDIDSICADTPVPLHTSAIVCPARYKIHKISIAINERIYLLRTTCVLLTGSESAYVSQCPLSSYDIVLIEIIAEYNAVSIRKA